MENLIGVMQGRLLPKYNGRYQAHPVGYWDKEFDIAADLGLDCIEFILDYNDVDYNPLLNSKGINQIKDLIKKTGVKVVSVCADYLMEAPLHADQKEQVNVSIFILKKLLNAAVKLDIKDIVIPCVDNSSIKDLKRRTKFQHSLMKVIPIAEQLKINLSLETDLAPDDFKNILHQFNSKYVTVNYDIGNSASQGYDPNDELKAYGSKISDIHIKDRLLGGKSVKLGTGNADLHKFFSILSNYKFKGPFIMQAYRDEQGINIFLEQLQLIKPLIKKIK